MRVCQFRHFGTVSEALVHRCSFISVAKPRVYVKPLNCHAPHHLSIQADRNTWAVPTPEGKIA